MCGGPSVFLLFFIKENQSFGFCSACTTLETLKNGLQTKIKIRYYTQIFLKINAFGFFILCFLFLERPDKIAIPYSLVPKVLAP